MRAAYRDPDPLHAEGDARGTRPLARQGHPGAAGSLREGLAETLTVNRLGVPPTLARTLRSTNAIESMIEICRDHSSNVKRWRDGQMALRWCAAGMHEAAKQFRRVNGHLHLAALRVALDRTLRDRHTHVRDSGGRLTNTRAVTQVPRNSGHPRRSVERLRVNSIESVGHAADLLDESCELLCGPLFTNLGPVRGSRWSATHVPIRISLKRPQKHRSAGSRHCFGRPRDNFCEDGAQGRRSEPAAKAHSRPP